MTRNEWINTLRDALMAEVPQNEIDNNVAFYRDYIDRETENHTEDEVLQTLGEPRLIAKTIIDTYQLQRGSDGYNAYGNQSYDYGNTYEQNRSQDEEYQTQQGHNSGFHYEVKTIKWYHKAIIFAVLALIVVLLVIVGGVILRLFFTIGLPVLLILFVIQMIRRK